MQSLGMLRSADIVRTDVSEEHIASIITVTKLGELRSSVASYNQRCS
jgi:hypothetical protein